jgi:hypothetical protein
MEKVINYKFICWLYCQEMETSLREFAEFQDADEVLLFERATFLGIFISVSDPYSCDSDPDPIRIRILSFDDQN